MGEDGGVGLLVLEFTVPAALVGFLWFEMPWTGRKRKERSDEDADRSAGV